MKKMVLHFCLIILLLLSYTVITQASPTFTLVYVVQPGDNLVNISEKYNISVDALRKVNNISHSQMIKAGEELIIPRQKIEKKEKKHPENWDYSLLNSDQDRKNNLDLNVNNNYAMRVNPGKTMPEVDIPPDKIIKYHISRGDTLFDLAREFNTSTGVIMALNDMENNIIQAGQTLKIPINNLSSREVLARTISKKELDILARAIYGEARGEPFKGQIAVGAVIINRVVSSAFPDTFRKVIYQKDQFTVVQDGQINLKPNQTAYNAARRALDGYDPTLGALYYYNPNTAQNQKWFSSRRLLVTIGDHVFAK